jgi:hypothetical protein
VCTRGALCCYFNNIALIYKKKIKRRGETRAKSIGQLFLVPYLCV